jgi:hypothetical protein
MLECGFIEEMVNFKYCWSGGLGDLGMGRFGAWTRRNGARVTECGCPHIRTIQQVSGHSFRQKMPFIITFCTNNLTSLNRN